MLKIHERVDRATHIPEDRRIETPPIPRSAKIEVTSRCNYKCSCCVASEGLREQGDMDFSFFKKIVRDLGFLGVEEIGLFLLGEPLLIKNLHEWVEYCKKEVGIPYIFITTNGSLLTLDVSKNLIHSGLDSLKVSVNAGEKERYKKVHGVDAFDTVVKNIESLHKYKKQNNLELPRTCVSSIFDNRFSEEFESFRNFIENYVDDYYYLPMYNQAGHVHSADSCVVGNPGRLDNMVAPVPCWALFNCIKISWDGFLTACCFDHTLDFRISDLRTTSILEAWNSPKFIELRRQHLNNDLKNSLCSRCLGLI
jgi:organic radical activating enzyme